MKIHLKVLRFFLLPTLTFILLRLAYYLSLSKALEIITAPDKGTWRVVLIACEIVFYIVLYIIFQENNKFTIKKYNNYGIEQEKLIEDITKHLKEASDEKIYHIYYKKDSNNTITILATNESNLKDI